LGAEHSALIRPQGQARNHGREKKGGVGDCCAGGKGKFPISVKCSAKPGQHGRSHLGRWGESRGRSDEWRGKMLQGRLRAWSKARVFPGRGNPIACGKKKGEKGG